MGSPPASTDAGLRRIGPPGLRLAFTFMVAAGAGCAPVFTAAHPLGAERVQQMRAEVDGRFAEVRLRQPVAVGAAAAPRSRLTGRVFIDEATVRVFERHDRVVLQPLTQVREIDASHRLAGGVAGFVVGALAGLLLGDLIGTVTAPDCSRPHADADCMSSRRAAPGTFAIMFSVPGALLGSTIGAAMGAGPIWRLSPETSW